MKLLDPEDAGIFSRKDCRIDKWKLIIAMKQLVITQQKSEFTSETHISMAMLKLKEDSSSSKFAKAASFGTNSKRPERRFPSLMKCEKGIDLNIKRYSRAWSGYFNEDMTATINIDSSLVINWQPLGMNRLVRFLRFMKIKSQVRKTELNQWLARYKTFNAMTGKHD